MPIVTWVVVIYLDPTLLPDSSGTPCTFVPGTALHLGKDLAVSIPAFAGLYPEGSPLLSLWASLFAPRGLLQMGVTHYLAALILGKCSDFPPREIAYVKYLAGRLPDLLHLIIQYP